MTTIRIGGGAGFSGDRIEPAVELVEQGDLDYLIFECLAERTIALAQQVRLRNPQAGYDPWLRERMEAVLPACHEQGIRIVTNMGAANPVAAGAEVAQIARRLGRRGLTVATVTGDDVLALVRERRARLLDSGRPVDELGDTIVAAHAYLGAEPIVEALAAGADVVVTGRVADPSLGVAAQRHAFGWESDDWTRLGQATVVGHLIECAGQITGGYFADPGLKDVPGLARLGFPIAVVDEDGTVTITKVRGSGGCVTRQTVLEQLFYEVHRPDRYVTPDTVADFSGVTVTELGEDQVQVTGGRGAPRPETLKVSVGYVDGFRGEGEISYAGPGAVARGRLAGDIVAARLAQLGVVPREIRYDLIGVDAMPAAPDASCHGGATDGRAPAEIRLRVAGLMASRGDAERIGREVEALLTNGPAGGGGATRRVGPALTVESTLVPRERVTPVVTLETA